MVWLAVMTLAAMALYLWWRPRRTRLLGVSTATTDNGIAVAVDPTLAPNHNSPMLGADATTLRVDGMTCTLCADSVRDALTNAPGIIGAEVELDTGMASVTYDPKATSIDQMMAPLRELGFLPTPRTRDAVAGQPRNAAITVPPGCARTSFQVEYLRDGRQLAEARRILLALPGVRDAGAHRRGNGEDAAIVWAIFDPDDVTAERIAAAVDGFDHSLACGEV
jgi:copper chaperone CopZ